MHVFWERGELTTTEVRDELDETGRDLAYTTVATLIRILTDKNFLKQTNTERPYVYCPVRSFEEVSGRIVGDLVQKLFGGSREQLLIRLIEQERLTANERAMLEEILKEQRR
jgi:predicted transcriptional regulator